MATVAARYVVYPELKNAELQNAYKVMGEESLLKKMLIPGEFNALLDAVADLNGFEEDLTDLVEEAKN